MKRYRKHAYPVEQIRRFIEPGPVVLVSTQWLDVRDVMTMGWHMVLEFSPSLLACCIARGNHSHALARRSRQCVINIPTVDIADTVVRIGNTCGAQIDKFQTFGLTTTPGHDVNAPLIDQCYASFECRLHDDRLIDAYDLFVWEVVHAHVARTPKWPQTIHYRGDGQFMVSGAEISRRRLFRPEML